MSGSLFYKSIPLRSADDVPIFSFANTILMKERPKAKEVIVLGDEDESPSELPAGVAGMTGYLMRWPHLVYDAIGAFDDTKSLPAAEAFERIKQQSALYLNSWSADNIAEVIIKAPEVTSPRKRAAFIGLGVNQYFAAGLMFSGKENNASSYRLWTLLAKESTWKEAPDTLCFPSHNGTGLLNGGYKLFIFCKQTLRCIDCVSGPEPFQVWCTDKIEAENPTLAADYVCGIRGGFGRVFLETFDRGVQLFNVDTGEHLQTILPELTTISIACTHELLLIGCDGGIVEAYGRENETEKTFSQIGRFQYGGEMQTKSGNKFTVEQKPIVQLIVQNSKICFAMGRQVFMEEKHPQMKRLRILESLPAVALAMVADYVLVVSPDASVRLCLFGERHVLFEHKYKELASEGTWRHNQEYTAGTFAMFSVLFPNGNIVRLQPKKLIAREVEQ